MQYSENVAIFWDYENCPAPSNASGYTIASNISSLARPFGSIKVFKAYLEISDQIKTSTVRSELQSSGVTLVDCPHNGRKEVADKMLLVDMLSYAIDNPAPSTILLITGDRDFAYALSILKQRQYRVILVTLPNAHVSLTFQACICFDWSNDVVNRPSSSANSQGQRQRQLYQRHRQEERTYNPSLTRTSPVQVVDPAETATDPEEAIDIVHFLPARTHQAPAYSKVNPFGRTSNETSRDDGLAPTRITRGAQSSPATLISGNRAGPSQEGLQVLSPAKRPLVPFNSITVNIAGNTHSNPLLDEEPANDSTRPPRYSADLHASPRKSKLVESSDKLLETGMARTVPSFPPTPASSPPTMLPATTLPSLKKYVAATKMTEDVNHASELDVHEEGNGPKVEPPTVSAMPSSISAIKNSTMEGLQASVSSTTAQAVDITSKVNTSSPPGFPTALASAVEKPNAQQPATNPKNSTLAATSGTSGTPEVLDIPPIFEILVNSLQFYREKGLDRPLRSDVACQISKSGTTYQKAGVNKFKQYMELAVKAGIVELGDRDGTAWVSLTPKYSAAVPSTS